MTSSTSYADDPRGSLEWRLYRNMLLTRLFEEALLQWEREEKISAQTFPSKGQEAIAAGCCLALEEGDTVIPSFRTRGAMIGMGVSIVDQLREFLHSPLAAGDSRDAPHHSSWPERGVMPGSTMIGGHLPMAAGLALAARLENRSNVSVAFFGDGTLGSGDLYETMHIAGRWKLPLILVCENNGWEMSTPWAKVRKTRSLVPYAAPFGLACRTVDGNDALAVYRAAGWAREAALSGSAVFLDCLTFRTGLYSSHFGEVRPEIEQELSEWQHHDPLKKMAARLIEHRLATAQELESVRGEEEAKLKVALKQVMAEMGKA